MLLHIIHPGWARSNFASGGNAVIKGLIAITKPIFRLLNFSDSSWESAQTSLHCLLSDEASKHSGAYFSQHSVLYRDKECKAGGWPMKSPNPHANDISAAKKNGSNELRNGWIKLKFQILQLDKIRGKLSGWQDYNPYRSLDYSKLLN